MGNNNNENYPKEFLPIPADQAKILQNSLCNFSLYSPRMVKWKREGKELKSCTDTMVKLANFFNVKRFSDILANKQVLQENYLKSLKDLGVETFSFRVVTSSPFVTGLGSGHPTETGMILDRNLGVPYIPASSIKGVLRLAHAINIANGRSEVPDSELEKYFGTADTKKEKQYKGQLIFLDAYPVGNVELKVDIMNPHYTKYYDGTNKQPVETESPVPIKFLTVKEGTEFIFHCAFIPLNQEDKCDKKEIEDMFKTAFAKVGFGGKTSIGYGRFKEKKDSVKTQQSAYIQKNDLEAGEYKSVIRQKDKTHYSILFEVKNNIAIKKNLKPKDFDKYKKNSTVKIIIDGTKDKNGYYEVTEIKM